MKTISHSPSRRQQKDHENPLLVNFWLVYFLELDNFSSLFTRRKQNVEYDLYILAVVYKLLDVLWSKLSIFT